MKKNENVIIKNHFIIKVYKNDVFAGYVISYRKGRNGYVFKKSKYIHKAASYIQKVEIERVKFKLTNLGNSILNNDYFFEIIQINDQEIRFSKLTILKTKKIKSGLFKNKI